MKSFGNMDSPIPTQRSQHIGDTKKPIPTPRRTIKAQLEKIPEPEVAPKNEENTNTLSKKVSSISSASKQFAEDIGQLVHDRKKAVIEGTRQSVRRLTRRFSSSSQEQNNNSEEVEEQKNEDENINIFSSIRFNSPISQTDSIYSNVDNGNESYSSDEDSTGLPPPNHPPPPPPDESLYDAPLSICSSNTSFHSATSKQKSEAYESVFPVCASGNASKENNVLSRSESWSFYDIVTPKENETSASSENSDPAAMLEPVLCKNKSIKDDSISVDVRNSMYENHDIIPKKPPRASKSVILQFDPPNMYDKEFQNQRTSDMQLLEELLQGDLYGNISNVHTIDEWSISNESEGEDVISPPTPPMRVDSLPEGDEGLENAAQIESDDIDKNHPKSRSSWFTGSESSKKPQRQNSFLDNKKHSWFKHVKEALEKAPDVVRGMKNKDNVVERAAIAAKPVVQKRGMLYKVQSGPVEDLFGEYSGRWCVIENGGFLCYSDNTCQHLKEHFRAQNILSIQILQDKKYNYRYDNDDLYCFELNITGKSRIGHIYGSRNISERRVWMQLIAESLISRFSSKITTNFTRMGWCYIREGVSGKWVGAWVILSQREFYYVTDGHPAKLMDLRKARCIVLQNYQDTDNNPKTNDKGPNMLIDSPNLALYLRFWTSRETKVWCHIVKLEAHNNGANLDQQQLTKNNIPVIVEKCINYIYAHGSMSVGIYRRPGTGSAVADLLAKFRKDSFAVQLTTEQNNEYEVSTALKRFFRDLPEPLLGSNQRQYLYEVSKHNNKDERIRMYRAALEQLPPISYSTARKLFGHLHFISSQSAKNLMTVDNLASLWGPTLLHYEDEETTNNAVSHKMDPEVVGQIISLYRNIFPEDPGEMEKEKVMLKVLEKYSNSKVGQSVGKKTAGDFRIWIFLHNKEGKSFNVSIEPNKSAYEVCKELCSHINLEIHEIILEEVILNDKLIRPIHYEEKVLDVVLKWSYWSDQDRKDNYLTLVPLSKYWEYILDKPIPISGEIRYADCKSRLYKLITFQFSQGKLSCFKDKSSESTLHSWNIEEITWYLGHESKRSPPYRWTVTFIENNTHPTRSRSTPYFGNVLVWNDAALRANWLSAMLKARYPNNLAPPPNLVRL